MSDSNDEIKAMNQIRLAVLQNSLDNEAARRVLEWAYDVFIKQPIRGRNNKLADEAERLAEES